MNFKLNKYRIYIYLSTVISINCLTFTDWLTLLIYFYVCLQHRSQVSVLFVGIWGGKRKSGSESSVPNFQYESSCWDSGNYGTKSYDFQVKNEKVRRLGVGLHIRFIFSVLFISIALFIVFISILSSCFYYEIATI